MLLRSATGTLVLAALLAASIMSACGEHVDLIVPEDSGDTDGDSLHVLESESEAPAAENSDRGAIQGFFLQENVDQEDVPSNNRGKNSPEKLVSVGGKGRASKEALVQAKRSDVRSAVQSHERAAKSKCQKAKCADELRLAPATKAAYEKYKIQRKVATEQAKAWKEAKVKKQQAAKASQQESKAKAQRQGLGTRKVVARVVIRGITDQQFEMSSSFQEAFKKAFAETTGVPVADVGIGAIGAEAMPLVQTLLQVTEEAHTQGDVSEIVTKDPATNLLQTLTVAELTGDQAEVELEITTNKANAELIVLTLDTVLTDPAKTGLNGLFQQATNDEGRVVTASFSVAQLPTVQYVAPAAAPPTPPPPTPPLPTIPALPSSPPFHTLPPVPAIPPTPPLPKLTLPPPAPLTPLNIAPQPLPEAKSSKLPPALPHLPPPTPPPAPPTLTSKATAVMAFSGVSEQIMQQPSAQLALKEAVALILRGTVIAKDVGITGVNPIASPTPKPLQLRRLLATGVDVTVTVDYADKTAAELSLTELKNAAESGELAATFKSQAKVVGVNVNPYVSYVSGSVSSGPTLAKSKPKLAAASKQAAPTPGPPPSHKKGSGTAWLVAIVILVLLAIGAAIYLGIQKLQQQEVERAIQARKDHTERELRATTSQFIQNSMQQAEKLQLMLLNKVPVIEVTSVRQSLSNTVQQANSLKQELLVYNMVNEANQVNRLIDHITQALQQQDTGPSGASESDQEISNALRSKDREKLIRAVRSAEARMARGEITQPLHLQEAYMTLAAMERGQACGNCK